MRKTAFTALAALAILCGTESFADTPRFEKVSDHCYYLQPEEGGANVAVVVSEQGILMVDPPGEENLPAVVDALRRISLKAVRWIVLTDPSFLRTAGTRYFAERGALLLASAPLQELAESGTDEESENPNPLNARISQAGPEAAASSFRWLIFDHEMRLFPSDLEVRILALRHKARTGGDVVAYVPDEKVLFVGDLYESARYPDIDTASEGSALEWVDGMEQVIDSIPVLKSAIPADNPGSEKEEDRTLEEDISVVSARGEVSNLQNMKDLLEACQKLQRYVKRSVNIGRSSNRFLALSSTGPYYSYGNLPHYASQLFEALEPPAEPKPSANP